MLQRSDISKIFLRNGEKSGAALGEFGAVNALSKTRGETFTLPLEIDALYMSGTDSSITSAFAVSSILLIIALIILFARNIVEHKFKKLH